MMSNVQTSPAPSLPPALSGGRASARAKAQQNAGDQASTFGDLLTDAGGSGAPKADPADTEKTERATKKADRATEADPVGIVITPDPVPTANLAPVSLHQMALNRPLETAVIEKTADAENASSDAQKEMAMAPAAKPAVPTIRPHGPPTTDPVAQEEAAPLKSQVGLIDPHGPPDQTDPEPVSGNAENFAPEIPTKLPPVTDDPTIKAAEIPTKQPPVTDSLPGKIALERLTKRPPVGDGTRGFTPVQPTKLPPVVDPTMPTDPNVQTSVVAGMADALGKSPSSLIEPHGPPIMPPDDVTNDAPPASGTVVGALSTTKAVSPDPTGPIPTKLPPIEVRDARNLSASLPTALATDRVLPDPNPPVVRTGTGVLPAGDPAAKTAVVLPPATSQAEITTIRQAQNPILTTPTAPPPAMTSGLARASADTGSETSPVLPGTPQPKAETDTTAQTTPANLASHRFSAEPKSADSIRDQQLQVAESEQLKYKMQADGTSTAKEQTDMTATLAEPAINRSDLLRRGFGVSTGRTGAIPGAEKTATGLPTFQADAPAQTTPVAAAAPTTTANAAVMADRVEHILQTVLDAGIKAGTRTENQMDLRVRLDGGANDVTVRIQMNENRMHVTFQTDSAGLRQALERGWGDFTAHAAHSASVTVEPPGFATPQGQTAGTNDFSQGQQNASQQDARRAFDADAPTFESAPRTAPAFTTSTTARPTPAPIQGTATRWTGWA